MKLYILLAIALIFGLVVAYVDTRATWDDTGVTAGAIVLISALFGAIHPHKPWMWGVSVGGPIALYSLSQSSYVVTLIVLLLAFTGAYGAAFIRRSMLSHETTEELK